MANHPTYPVTTIAKLLMISERRVQQLTKEGVIPKAERGRYELAPAVQGYIRFLSERNLQIQDSHDIDVNAEKAKKLRAEAEIAQIEAEKAKKGVVGIKQVEKTLTNTFIELKAGLRNIPRRVANTLVGETSEARIKSVILDEVDQTLEVLAQYDPDEREELELDESE